MRIKTWRIALFALVLVAGAVFQVAQINSTRLVIGKPFADRFGTFFVSELYFPGGGYAAISFDSTDQIVKFAQLPNVDVRTREGDMLDKSLALDILDVVQ